MKSDTEKITRVNLMLFSQDGCIALVYKWGDWFLPGGEIQENESRYKALLRNMREELGFGTLDPKIARFVRTFDRPEWDEQKRYFSKNYLYIIPRQCYLIAGQEIKEARWFSFQNLPARFAFHYHDILDIAQEIAYEQRYAL